MSTPIHAQVSGTFTTPSSLVPVNLSLPCGFDTIEISNISDIMTATNTPAEIVKAEGKATYPASSSITYSGTGSGLSLTVAASPAAGFTFVSDSGNLANGSLVTNISAISNANPAVVSTTTPASVGQVVRLSNTTGALQLSGMDFQVTAQTPSTSMSLGYLGGAPGSAATGGDFYVVNTDSRFYPRWRFITGITKAASAVVTMSVAHGYTVGQEVRFQIPAAWGMTQLNGLLGTITAVTASTITVNINTSAFSSFTFPSSATAATGVSFAIVIPVGEAATAPYQNLLDDKTLNTSFTGVTIDTGILVASKNYSWTATKGQTI